MAKQEEAHEQQAAKAIRVDVEVDSADQAMRRRRERLESMLRMLNGKRTVMVLESDSGTQVRVQGQLKYERKPSDGITEDDTRREYRFSDYAIVKFA